MLLELVKTVSGFEHLSVFTFSDTFTPTIEVLEGLEDRSITQHSAHSYLGFGYFSSDPAIVKLQALSSTADAPAFFVLRACDIQDDAYRRDIYERFGLDGRVSLIGRTRGQWRSVNFYKHILGGGITESRLRALVQRAPFLFAAEARHIELLLDHDPLWSHPTLPPLPFLRHMIQSVCSTLSPRELEVCARALQGMTGEATALDMQITEATVATLRRRAYVKMNISTLNELFALCLAAAASRATARPPMISPANLC
jgi:DNA-binding CsgD family transcriptional regulator